MQDLSRYSVCGEIASGSTATVFLAEDKVLRRKVALKRLHPHLLGHSETVKRFRKEALAIASLSHANIVQVYDYGDKERDLFLAMEYVDGASLESLLAPTGPLPALAGLGILRQLMQGLAAAHGAGIVHRDVKPSNVLVDRRGCVRIADFGIAFLAEENSITKTGSYLGTPVYSSPEQADGLPATDKTDIFSSGIVFYRCFTGRLPFQGENSHAILKSIVEMQPRKPSALNRRLFPGLSELTLAMLSKAPDKRPSAAECAAELAAVAARVGLEPATDRVRRFVAEPETYPAVEREEIGNHFMAEAARAREKGEGRKAAKLEALAELYSGMTTQTEREEAYRQAVAYDPRRRRIAAAAGALAAACVVGGLAWAFLRSPGNGNGDPAAAPIAAKAAATAIAGSAMPALGALDARIPAAASPAMEPDREGSAMPPVNPAASGTDAAPAAQVAAVSGPVGAGAPSSARKAPRTPGPGAAAVPVPASVHAATESAAAVTAAPGGLIVKSNPPFAAVTVDGREAGRTPFKTPLALAPGEHEVLLEREGCLPLKQTVKVESGETAVLRLTLGRSRVASE